MYEGKTLDSAIIERGLLELCPDLQFDLGSKLSDWRPTLAIGHKKHGKLRQGVAYRGRHICAMDRGLVPEFKQWSVITRLVPVGWEEAEKDDVSLQTQVIPKTSDEYVDCILKCMAKEQGYEYRPDGAIIRYTPMAYRKVRGGVIMVGWRHTFERLINANLPGLTRSAIAQKFAVDMLKFPVGAPHELIAALTEE